MIDIQNITVARRYSKAIFELSHELLPDLTLVKQTLELSEELKNFLEHPVIRVEDKKSVVQEVFKSQISAITLDFLLVLIEKNRMPAFNSIVDSYADEIDKLNNLSRIKVVSAVELDSASKEALRAKLENKLKKQVKLEYDIDKSIMAGLIIKIHDKIIDISLKSRLDQLKRSLLT